jgi:dipeptidyl aminopeptidase/acylaminoacyl peptidase
VPLPANFVRTAAASLLAVAAVTGCSARSASTHSPDESAPPVSVASPPSAVPSAAVHDLSGHILFTRTVGQDEHLFFIANADGTNECRIPIPPDSGAGCEAAGARRILLFIGDSPNSATGTPATMRVDGSGYAVLPISDPTLNYIPQRWSPDGTRIAFEGWDASSPDRNGIYTARATDGGDIVRVTSHEGPHDIPADYSPDGTQIVFFRSAVEEPGPWDLGGALWVVNVDGSGARQLATPGVMPSPGARWSPDGSKILFSTARAQLTGALWTVNADGSNLTRIFQDADPTYPHGRYATGPVWSPDGRQIMFTLDPIADWFDHSPNGIYVINADGTGLTAVSGGSTFKSMLEWWP